MYYIRIGRRRKINLRVIYVFADFCSCGRRKLDSYLYCQFPWNYWLVSLLARIAYAIETFGDFFRFLTKVSFECAVLFSSGLSCRVCWKEQKFGAHMQILEADWKTNAWAGIQMGASLEQIQLECLNYVNLGSVKWRRVYISDQWWQLISAKSHFLCDSTGTWIYYLGLVRTQKLWRYGKLFLHTYSVRGVNSARKAWIQAVGSARRARQTQVCGRVFLVLHLSFVRRQRWGAFRLWLDIFKHRFVYIRHYFVSRMMFHFKKEYYRVYPSQWLYDSFRFELFMTLLW